jgi:hypothetical protein
MPSLRSRHHLPATFEDYVAGLLPSYLFALVLAWGAASEYISKPLKNKRLGYQLVGRFTVLDKQKLLGKAWLELEPDHMHRVGVTEQLFERFRKGMSWK